MMCNGNSTEFCGGPNRLNAYSLGTAAPPPPPPPPPPAGGPTQPATIANYNFLHCRTEATGIRALSSATFAADTMTLESCASFCGAYTYFGVEYGQECYCGDQFNAGSVEAPQSECNMVCPGNSAQYCGAGNRLSVYIKSGTAPPPPPPPGTTTTTSTTMAVSTTAPPAGTGFPAGWSAHGCWVDGAQGRILSYQAPDNPALTLQSCANLCASQGYSIAGMEYSYQCFCGNEIINGGVQSSEAECNMNCAGNPAQKCGGPNRMTIYSNGPPTIYGPPGPQTGGLPGWTYAGCYTDNVNNVRTFYWQLFFPGVMTPKMCLDRCIAYGYHAAGLEYGEECYCGDPANIATRGSTLRPESECNVQCAGNSSAICGGGSRLSTYFWTGTPKYTWTFPQGAAAGSYTFLIGGVCIPLITTVGVNGKVTFLEKAGTGPPNSTGAYELDLAQLNDFNKAWRTMHVKTDVFCAASVTLPDKAGRQLNVGGWSGDSTYGVRLYLPDGSPGQPSVNDWEEDVTQLKLQAGRWYPTAMIMANGSVLVIGGEEGSNGRAVPSLEILPYTGTAPLYMDWLERTDPNNLYPFVCVLPSGGIFVAYWNEARILDEVTFATTKVLPNIPGAVNDDKGGRTYPLEGTAVLLPQKAPYTDPLGILICGGSTEGPGNALDNCVSTYPEVANPVWQIERMPSFRVVGCMAPLPDGTYLIANGAEHGVAGFGLATKPNLNALLYDPEKPLGSRITVMANTTVARLYHSEAITLLDGRVLISGSDPQDGINPQEYRVEVFNPPYITLNRPRPSFTLTVKDYGYGSPVTLTNVNLPNGAGNYKVSLLAAVSSTHGNSMGARTIFPAVTCGGGTCTVTTPPNAHVCPPGWYMLFLVNDGVPSHGVYVRIGGDPAGLGNWPPGNFKRPGV